MLKKTENKTRKRLRITQCVLFLAEILFCTFTYVNIPNPDSSKPGFYATVFDMLSYLGGDFPQSSQSSAFSASLPLYFVFLILPIVGFFFCALDKERNMKNLVSIACSLLGVFSILTVISINFISYGSLLALLFYILISFITAFAMMARLTDEQEELNQSCKSLLSIEDYP